MDPLEVIGGAIVSAKIVEKVLGPTADYLGESIHAFAKKRIETVQNIFAKGARKLGDRINSPGAVPPRVLAGILSDGSYRDDELSCEYYGGVLASSRTDVPRDDRAAALLNLVSRLSTYQLRSHYIVYRVIFDLFRGSGRSIALPEQRRDLRVYIPFHAWLSAMDFSSTENADGIQAHSIFGIAKEQLIGDTWGYGPPESLTRWDCKNAPGPGMVVEPSALGVELFMHAMGLGQMPFHLFLFPGIAIVPIEGITIPAGSFGLKDSPVIRQGESSN